MVFRLQDGHGKVASRDPPWIPRGSCKKNVISDHSFQWTCFQKGVYGHCPGMDRQSNDAGPFRGLSASISMPTRPRESSAPRAVRGNTSAGGSSGLLPPTRSLGLPFILGRPTKGPMIRLYLLNRWVVPSGLIGDERSHRSFLGEPPVTIQRPVLTSRPLTSRAFDRGFPDPEALPQDDRTASRTPPASLE